MSAGTGDNVTAVRKHYNQLPESNLQDRSRSRIFHMRNFNNWIKSVLIDETVQRVRQQFGSQLKPLVLDMCCGKGGDLNKWKFARIDHIVMADLADVSVDQCRSRYEQMVGDRRPLFTADFVTADCSRQYLHEKCPRLLNGVHISSCQFSLHYGFESEKQAHYMLKNACEYILPGGYFICTLPDGYELIRRFQEAKKQTDNGSNKPDPISFGNDIYSVTFADDTQGYPLYGHKFHFKLDEQVNVPEYVVNPRLLELLLKDLDMELVLARRFDQFFHDNIDQPKHQQLIRRMRALEQYPSAGTAPVGATEPADAGQYETARKRLAAEPGLRSVNTISRNQWDAITLYSVFMFRKRLVRHN